VAVEPAPEPSSAIPRTGDPPTGAAASARHGSQARERLRLARVVLEAGFPADAVRAAYDALTKAIAALLDDPPDPGHGALIAAVYRELLPAGRLPAGAHAALATLHDLCSLDSHGVVVDGALAAQAVTEAEQWVERLTAAVTARPNGGGYPIAARARQDASPP
jgi:hypothetical protein